MKALILAAGLGTRLHPYTSHTPKPLFPIAGTPLIQYVIDNLIQSGCRSIMINTHHLATRIERFIRERAYPIPITTRNEPEILGTGGAIKNTADFWDDEPFFVINSDIVTDIDLKAVYEYHQSHAHPATLVLKDDPEFNLVSVDKQARLLGFSADDAFDHGPASEKLAFTGIQVLDPEVLEHIPPDMFYSSIDAYRDMMSQGKTVKAFIDRNLFWTDIGSPARYRQAAYEQAVYQAFHKAWGQVPGSDITRIRLKGDGSDRKWYRLVSEGRTMVMVDHGIKTSMNRTEVDSFIAIGRHLQNTGIPVPEILHEDAFPGLVFLEDLGDVLLQDEIKKSDSENTARDYYGPVIQHLVRLSQDGGNGFNPEWTYQTRAYDQDMILEYECRYFTESFLNRFLGMTVRFKDLLSEFRQLSEKALEYAVTGFLHRDMQSRNIMVKNGECYFIDFQGGRMGPIQYDLASLLIDPYVELPAAVQDALVEDCIEALSRRTKINPDRFKKGYAYCRLTRNLQMLGAFAHLTLIKNKKGFRQYMKPAIQTLLNQLATRHAREFPKLLKVAETGWNLLD